MTGKEIRELRHEKHLTQKRLSELCGLSTTTISLIERDKREIRPKEEKLLADIFSSLDGEINKKEDDANEAGKETEKAGGQISLGKYMVYTDGGCGFNPGGPGGIGVVIVSCDTGEVQELSKGYFSSTNNRMEITAAIEALKLIPEGSKVMLRSDSQYLVNTMTCGWNRNKNHDLWYELEKAMEGKEVSFRWVRGHNGDQYNELCDELAKKGFNNPQYEGQ